MLRMEDGDFDRIVRFVRDNFGINLAKKRALVQGRLALEIERRGFGSFKEYFDAATASPNGPECRRMIDKLSTNHTFFFREPRCFEHMRDKAVPRLVARGVKRIDIWCAASATGQECYTIAMMMETALALHPDVQYHILASDVNGEVLEKGKRGEYPLGELSAIPEHYRRLYCRQTDDKHFQIVPALRQRVTWQRINLVQSLQAVPAQHLIFCRNVMIYFEPAAKERLTSELYRLVRDGGFVYVGNTETLDMKRTRFDYLGPAVFQKKGVVMG